MKQETNNSDKHATIITTDKEEFIKGLALILIVAVLMVVGTQFIGLARIRDWIDRAGIFGPIIFILLKASAIVFTPIAGTPFYLLAGPLYGFVYGSIYAYLGDLLGGAVAFYISRIFGRSALKLLLSDDGLKRVENIISRLGNWRNLVYARLIFIGLQDIVSFATGLTEMPFRYYIIITALTGIVPVSLAVAAGMALINQTVQIITVISLAFITLLFLGIRYFMKNRKNNSATTKTPNSN